MRRKYLVFLLILVILFLLSGCSDTVKEDDYISGEGNLKVVVNWDEINNLQTQQLSNDIINTQENNTIQVTHTAARVEYVGQNAVFTQMVERQTAVEEGIITFQIPATNNANLYSVAVHISGEYNQNRALYLGKVKNIQIPADGIVEVKMSDLDWVEATWYPYEEYSNFESEIMVASKEDEYYKMPIYVRDPYHIGEDLSYSSLLVGISGTSSSGDNPDGWRTFDVYNKNHDIGVVHEENYGFDKRDHGFQPHVDSNKFNLDDSNGRFYILPLVNDYTISWE